MTAVKVVNYTAEQTAEIVTRFNAGETTEALATAFGKSTRSIVAKLSREGVYKAKSKAKAEVRIKKDALVAKIAEFIGADQEKLDSLEKATAEALTLVLNALEGK